MRPRSVSHLSVQRTCSIKRVVGGVFRPTQASLSQTCPVAMEHHIAPYVIIIDSNSVV
jgi:hypothetical protein